MPLEDRGVTNQHDMAMLHKAVDFNHMYSWTPTLQGFPYGKKTSLYLVVDVHCLNRGQSLLLSHQKIGHLKNVLGMRWSNKQQIHRLESDKHWKPKCDEATH